MLPGIDDGAKTLEESLEMLRLLAAAGFTLICATPHQKVGAFVPSALDIADRFQTLHREAQALNLTLHVAAENFWDDLFLARARDHLQPAYQPSAPTEPPAPLRRGAFLFELPVNQLPVGLEQQLFQFRLRGLVPVMAHPERYAPLWGKHARVEALGRTAALVVDLAALDGAHGPERAKAARALISENLCHAVASDIHQASDIRAVMSGMSWIKKKFGERRLSALLVDNPRQILAGELPDLPG